MSDEKDCMFGTFEQERNDARRERDALALNYKHLLRDSKLYIEKSEADIRELERKLQAMTEGRDVYFERNASLKARLQVLQRYHGGDGTVTREQVMEALSGSEPG